MTIEPFGFTPEEVDTSAPTRNARLKWVIAVNRSLPSGRAVNAAACIAAATGTRVMGLLGPDAVDADGSAHPGLPWAGCTVLGADPDQLVTIRAKAEASPGVMLVDMPAQAQSTRVYDEYLESVSPHHSNELEYYAVSIVGPRNRIDRIVGRIPLLP